jgi:hypothetical protein
MIAKHNAFSNLPLDEEVFATDYRVTRDALHLIAPALAFDFRIPSRSRPASGRWACTIQASKSSLGLVTFTSEIRTGLRHSQFRIPTMEPQYRRTQRFRKPVLAPREVPFGLSAPIGSNFSNHSQVSYRPNKVQFDSLQACRVRQSCRCHA